jgi:arabinose-5-phosphate isomerase
MARQCHFCLKKPQSGHKVSHSNIKTNKALDFNTPAHKLMSDNPKTLGPEEQAIQAINLMETYKITSLAITDSERNLMGVIHMHSLLSSGLI